MAVAAYIFVEATQGKAIEICEEINKIKDTTRKRAVFFIFAERI